MFCSAQQRGSRSTTAGSGEGFIRYSDGSEELYDHGAATAETKNIAKANPTVVEKLRARLQKQLALGQR